MKTSELRQIIKEEIQTAIFKQRLNEGKLGDFFSGIKSAAINAAKANYQDAMNHVDVDKLEAKPLPSGLLDKAQSEIEMESQDLNEGRLRDFIEKGMKTGVYGSAISALTALSAGTDYLEMSFNKWYYSAIQGMAEADVMKVMTDLYGAKAAESSIWFKLGMYAFFIFFTIAILSIIASKLTRKNK